MSKWPKKIKHRKRVLAKIYQPCRGRESYRVTWYAAGKRQMKSFPTYAGTGGAKEFAEGKCDTSLQSGSAANVPAAEPAWLVVRLAHTIEAHVFKFDGQDPFLGLVFDLPICVSALDLGE